MKDPKGKALKEIKLITEQEYREFIEEVNQQNWKDSINFYKSLNNILKYKVKNYIVKYIRIKGEIQAKEETLETWLQYYKKILKTEEKITNWWFSDWIKYEIDTRGALQKRAKNKAIRINEVPGDWIIANGENNETDKLKIETLHRIFTNWVTNKHIPEFWMQSKLILISKEENNTPEIQNTRPIAILPSITKAFEVSIIGNIEDIEYTQGYISLSQRRLTPNKSTTTNIQDLLKFCMQAKIRRKSNMTCALIFLDLKRAYDNVNRNKLLLTLKETRVTWDILEIIKIMLFKSKILVGEGFTRKKQRTTPRKLTLSNLIQLLY